MKTLLTVLLFLSAVATNATNYYISASGSSRNDGLTPQTALDLSSANRTTFRSDTIIIVGTVSGTLSLSSGDVTEVNKPIVIRSNGTKATITGISVQNLGWVEIRNLNVVGNGIVFYKNLDPALDHILIDSCDVSGVVGGIGINIGYNTKLNTGYNGITISNTSSHMNDKNGILIWGGGDTYGNTNISITNTKAYDNLGVLSITTQNTGSGIVVANSDGAVIDGCTAYNNGENNRNNGGGPIGIWMYNTRNGVIRNCESYGNHAGLYHDGGGFDLDGGCQSCTIENCFSHDNEGSGYLLAEYGSTNTYMNNAIRNNRSQNDGLKNSMGSIAIWAVDDAHNLNDCTIENNTFIVGASPIAINIIGGSFNNVIIQNNTFYVRTGTTNVSGSSSGVTLTNNKFLLDGALPVALNSYKLTRKGNLYEGSFVASATTDTKEFWIMLSTDGVTFKKVYVFIPQKIVESQTIKFSFTYEN